MLNQIHRRPPPPPQPSPAVVDDGHLACYGIVVACASLLLLTILAATVSIGKACAFAGAVGVAFGLVGCLARWRANGGGVEGVPAHPPPTAGRPCGTVAVDVLPAFAYARPVTDAAAEDGGSGNGKAGMRALCPVCLEDVQAGEMVRQLPACGHLFHVECIDMWLRSHSTCPLCRCDVWAQQPSHAKPTPEADPPDNALPPV